MKLLAIFRKDLQILARDFGMLAVLFLMPIAFIVAFCGQGADRPMIETESDNQRLPLPVLDYDLGPQARSFIASLDESLRVEQNLSPDQIAELGLADDPVCAEVGQACDEHLFNEMLMKSHREAVLIIPAGFSQAIEAGQYVSVTLRYDPTGDAMKRMQIEGVIKGESIRVSLDKMKEDSFGDMDSMTIYAPDGVQKAVKKEADKPTDTAQSPAFDIQTVHPASYTLPQIPTIVQQTVPGFAVMYVFFIISYVQGAIHEEKISGMFRRLLSVPVNRAALLGGKLLSALVVGVAQMVVMFAIGVLAFGLDLGQDVFALVVLTVVVVLTATSMGLAAAAFKIPEGAITVLGIIFALLGGCLFIDDMFPPLMRTIGRITPHSWAQNGYRNLLVRGYGLPQVLPQIGVLLGFAAVFFALAVWRFDFED